MAINFIYFDSWEVFPAWFGMKPRSFIQRCCWGAASQKLEQRVEASTEKLRYCSRTHNKAQRFLNPSENSQSWWICTLQSLGRQISSFHWLLAAHTCDWTSNYDWIWLEMLLGSRLFTLDSNFWLFWSSIFPTQLLLVLFYVNIKDVVDFQSHSCLGSAPTANQLRLFISTTLTPKIPPETEHIIHFSVSSVIPNRNHMSVLNLCTESYLSSSSLLGGDNTTGQVSHSITGRSPPIINYI